MLQRAVCTYPWKFQGGPQTLSKRRHNFWCSCLPATCEQHSADFSFVGLQGRSLVFEAQGGKLVTVCDREVKGAGYNVTGFRGSSASVWLLPAALAAFGVHFTLPAAARAQQ